MTTKITEKTTDTLDKNSLFWEHGGKQYPLFLVNGTGGIGMPIIDPVSRDKQIGMISAEFAWESSEPFLDHLDLETIDKATARGGEWTERENESLMLKNASLFAATVQRGSSVDFDEFGERKPEVPKTRAQMLTYRKPVQSDLISLWINECHIERYLPSGESSIDAFLSNPSEIFFTMKIGDYENPKHLLLFEFTAPSDDAISAYTKDSFKRGQNEQRDWKFTRDNELRLRFAKKYFKSVSGVMLGPKGQIEFDDKELALFDANNPDSVKQFKSNFNPEWMIYLGEELAGAFNLGKK